MCERQNVMIYTSAYMPFSCSEGNSSFPFKEMIYRKAWPKSCGHYTREYISDVDFTFMM